MTPAELITTALKLSIILLVFALGLRTELSELGYLLRRPGQLVRSLVAMNLIMPLFAAVLISVLDLPVPVKVVLVCLSLAPVPPILPNKQVKAGGHASYAVSLLCAAAAFSILSIPLTLELLERVFRVPLDIAAVSVAKIVLITVLLPLLAGIAVRAMLANVAERIAKPISMAATVVLLLGLVAILIAFWRAIAAELTFPVILAICAFIVFGLVAGHLLGGPDPSDRTVLALSTASRHPGVALAIASANFDEKKSLIALLLLYLLAGAVLSKFYLMARKPAAMPPRSAAPGPA